MTQTPTIGMAMFCCIAGTKVRTPAGDKLAEALRPGDLVTSLDHGSQPIVLTKAEQVEALGDRAPICLRAGTLGPHPALFVSPLHRFMIRDSLAALLFGDVEVLVAARDLVDGRSVTMLEGGLVDYVWLGFAAPQLIHVHGLVTGSFQLAKQKATPDQRRVLRPFEAQVLMTAAA